VTVTGDSVSLDKPFHGMLSAAASSKNLNLSSLPVLAVSGFSVWGKVEDATGRPIAGVEILLNGKASGARTNAEGIYRLEGISAGSYTLQASKVPKSCLASFRTVCSLHGS
jgi:hypothetical protein